MSEKEMSENEESRKSYLVEVCRIIDGLDAIQQARILRAARTLLNIDERLREAARHLAAFAEQDAVDEVFAGKTEHEPS